MSSHSYNTGCRCDDCREYQRARVARNRGQRFAIGLLTHGTRSAYDAGCRCTECLEARRAAYPRENEQARARYRTRQLGGDQP